MERGSKVPRFKQIILNSDMFEVGIIGFITAEVNKTYFYISHHQAGRLCTEMSDRISTVECHLQLLGKVAHL